MGNTKENILQKINGYIVNCRLSGINNEIEKLLTIVSEYEASQELATLFIKNYTLYKADALAAILEIMIRGHKRLALVNGALNPLFRLAIFKGSVDLYECYMEVAIYPFLEDKCEEDKNEYYEFAQIHKIVKYMGSEIQELIKTYGNKVVWADWLIYQE